MLWLTGGIEELRATQADRCRLARLAGNEFDELLALTNLVSVDELRGRFAAVIRDGREVAGRFQRRGFALRLGYLLAHVSWAHCMLGALDEAVHVLREAAHVLKHDATVFTELDVFALVVFARGRTSTAARLFGAAEAVFGRYGYRRHMLRQHRHETISERLSQALVPDELARPTHEGKALAEREAIALAVHDLESTDG